TKLSNASLAEDDKPLNETSPSFLSSQTSRSQANGHPTEGAWGLVTRRQTLSSQIPRTRLDGESGCLGNNRAKANHRRPSRDNRSHLRPLPTESNHRRAREKRPRQAQRHARASLRPESDFRQLPPSG